MAITIEGVFRRSVEIKSEPLIQVRFHFEIEPAYAPRTSAGGNLSMLRLHIARHAAFPAEVLPFRDTAGDLNRSVTPVEPVWTWGAFRMQGWGIKYNSNIL